MALFAGLWVSCVADDTGKACVGTASPPSSPLAGAPPAPTQLVLSRDLQCLSLQCLAAAGLQPFCSRTCSLTTGHGAAACNQDADCPRLQQCAGGRCSTDDCPAGFWCRVVQDVGPYAGQPFCMRRPCAQAADCGDGGHVACTSLGCYSGCADGAQCPAPQTVCRATSSLNCRCIDNSSSCADSQLQCQPPGYTAPLPLQAVQRSQICQPSGNSL